MSSLCHPVLLGSGRGLSHPIAIVPVDSEVALRPFGCSKASSCSSHCPSGHQARQRSLCCSVKARVALFGLIALRLMHIGVGLATKTQDPINP